MKKKNTNPKCTMNQTYGLFGWRGEGGGVEGSRVV